MWIARNKNGDLRIFDLPPRRFHAGPMLDSFKVGFNDAVTVGDDEYSFWAVQEYFESNRIDNNKNYGLEIYTEAEESGKKVWFKYIPECVKDLTWEDDPKEIVICLK